MFRAVCRPKHVEQLRNIGVINSTTRLHLVGSFYEIYITMHGSMNIKRITRFIYSKFFHPACSRLFLKLSSHLRPTSAKWFCYVVPPTTKEKNIKTLSDLRNFKSHNSNSKVPVCCIYGFQVGSLLSTYAADYMYT